MIEIVLKLLLEGYFVHISNSNIFIYLFGGTSGWLREVLFLIFVYTFPFNTYFMSHINFGFNAFFFQLFLDEC